MSTKMSTRKSENNTQTGNVKTDIFVRILKSPHKIAIEHSEIDEEGAIAFDVPLKQLGLSKLDLTEFSSVIKTTFFANFVGELFIRENIEDFVKLWVNLNPGRYVSILSKDSHRHFG